MRCTELVEVTDLKDKYNEEVGHYGGTLNEKDSEFKYCLTYLKLESFYQEYLVLAS